MTLDTNEVQVESESIPGKMYTVNTVLLTCTCPFHKYNKGKSCPHLRALGLIGSVEEEKYPFLALRKFPNSPDSSYQIEAYDKWLRTRVSPNFILRDFMFSAFASAKGIINLPENPDMVMASARMLCEKLCEPILAAFGRFTITYGYSSRELMHAEWPKLGPAQSSPHNWDRGTFGKEIYARIDILPFCVEDGTVSKEDFAKWMMMNLDIDLLMQWQKSNVLCVTISPKPRRVWLKWTPQGQGSGGSNKITYWGEQFWQSVWPDMHPEARPAHGPSHTGGKMFWKSS